MSKSDKEKLEKYGFLTNKQNSMHPSLEDASEMYPEFDELKFKTGYNKQ